MTAADADARRARRRRTPGNTGSPRGTASCVCSPSAESDPPLVCFARASSYRSPKTRVDSTRRPQHRGHAEPAVDRADRARERLGAQVRAEVRAQRAHGGDGDGTPSASGKNAATASPSATATCAEPRHKMRETPNSRNANSETSPPISLPRQLHTENAETSAEAMARYPPRGDPVEVVPSSCHRAGG